MPGLQAAYEELKSSGLVVLGIDFEEDQPVVATAAKEFGLSFPVLLDTDGQVSRRYRVDVTGHPSHYFIDRSGKIVDFRVGYASQAQLKARLSAIID